MAKQDFNKQEFEKILEALNELSNSLPDGEEKESVDAQVNELKEKYSGSFTDQGGRTEEFNLEEFNNDISELTQIGLSLPNIAKEKETESKILEALNGVTNVIAGISDLNIANKQINEARATLENIDQPQRLRPFKRSETLAQQIRNAQQGLSPSGITSRTAGLASDVEQNYLKDLNNAAIASAGQAGAYGSYSQAASRNRIRNALGLQEARSIERDRANRNLNYLATQQIRENQASDVNARARAEADYRRFIDQSQSAGNLLRAGQMNKRTSRNALLSQGLQNLIPSLVQARPSAQGIIPSQEKSYMRGAINAAPPKYNRYTEPLFDMNGSDFDVFDFNRRLNSYNVS